MLLFIRTFILSFLPLHTIHIQLVYSIEFIDKAYQSSLFFTGFISVGGALELFGYYAKHQLRVFCYRVVSVLYVSVFCYRVCKLRSFVIENFIMNEYNPIACGSLIYIGYI
ncbi:hypothetical protein HanIR_Chr13g0634741 [Helianthus annuus]|nr:hypothetical protein HanIR_Chr13g0634741 [Helianthus annuus]